MKEINDVKRISLKILSVSGWILASIIALLVIVILLIRIPWVQNKLTQTAISFLEEKIGTEVQLRHIYVSFPTKIVLQGLYLQDQKKDTLFYADELNIDTDLWSLTQNQIDLNSVELVKCRASVQRARDSIFNFDYIVDAFSGGTIKVEDTTATAWEFSIDQVSISETSLSFQDRLEGLQATAEVGRMKLDMKKFNLAELLFSIQSFELQNTSAEIVQSNLASADAGQDTSMVKMPRIDFDELNFDHVKIQYQNPNQVIKADLGKFVIQSNKFALQDSIIEIAEIQLTGSTISYRENRTSDPPKVDEEKKTSFTGLNIPWNIKIINAALTDNSIQYENVNIDRVDGSLDFNHLNIFGLQFFARDLAVKGNTLSGNITNLSFQEKSGLALQSLRCDLGLTDHDLDIRKFSLRSGNSKIDLQGHASFNSIEQIDHAIIDFHLDHSVIALQDLLLFSPTLLDSLPLNTSQSMTFQVDADLSGSLNNLHIAKLDIKTLTNTRLALQGQIKGLPDFDRTEMNLEIQLLHTVAKDINAILADSVIPTSVQLPEWIEMKGRYSGTQQVSAVDMIITSDVGQVNAQGKIKFSQIPIYDVTIKTKNFHLGKIIKQSETIGILDLQASAKGAGLNMDSINTTMDISVDRFQYNQYTYHNFNVEGTLKNYLFAGKGSFHDENLDLELEGQLDYKKDIPLYNFTLDLKNANFQKLNLAERPLKARGKLNISLATSDLHSVNGTMAIRKVAIYNGESLYMVDSLLFASLDQDGESSMTIQSDIISGEFKGTFNIFKLPGVLRQHINHYFSLQNEAVTAFASTQNFKFDLTLKNTDLITDILIPELDPFVPGKISGEFNSEENKLNIEIGVTQINYATTTVDSLSVFVTSDENELQYKFRLKNIRRDSLTIDALQLTGKIQHDSIYSAFQILNAKDEQKYVLGGVIKSRENRFRFRFLEDQIVLNYKKWKAPADHYLDFSLRGIQTRNFKITGGQEKIALITTVKDSTVSIEFDDLQLSSLTRMVRGVMPADGKLNGNIKFTTAAKGTFNSKLFIEGLEVLEQPYGNLTLALAHAANRYGIDLQIRNEDSNLSANGFYVSDPNTPAFKLDINLSPFNLKLIEPFSYGQLKNVKGAAEGHLQLSGNLKKPVVRGNILFREASFTSTYLNNTFSLTNEKISVTENGITLNNFTIRDNKKNEAVIEGDILTQAFRDFRFNLRLRTKNFQVLNTTAKDNKLFYGHVKVNTVIRLTGNNNRPRVDMTASLSPDSELTYVIPQAQKSVMEQEGIVQFVDKDAIDDPFLADLHLEDTVASSFAGMNISANLELTDKETLHIIIDPMTGDKLSVKGNSSLTFNMTASGNMNLSGRYEISEGSYNLSFYKLVKRKFDIEKGGTITWSGNPLNALLNLQAQHKVETTPMDLISNQINTTDQSQLNSYRQRLPFLVMLDIKGQLLAPQISFQIDMPIDKRAAFGGVIYAKLVDINSRESDVNKQVFALLILRRFISDNPLESQAGSDVANATRTSVSRILSEQLNRLSENIKGVQLSVDVKSYQDYSTGQAHGDTQVQLGVSKSLFDDRLVVKLSGNVDVEGENTSQEEATDYIGDLAIEYKLTRDGRFRVTGFRTNNYDLIDGELVETGAGLIYIKDYNTLRELFKRNARKK